MTDYKLITPDVIPGATSWAGAAVHHEQPLCYGDPISAWFRLSAICHELVPEPEGPGWLCSDTERGVCIFSCLISSVQKHQNAWVSFFFLFCCVLLLNLQSESRVALQSGQRSLISTGAAHSTGSVPGHCLPCDGITCPGDSWGCQIGEDSQ